MSAFLERFRADLPVPFDAAAAEVVAQARPPIVSFHFGLPSPDLLERVAGGHRGLFLSEDLQDQIGTLALVAEHNGLLQDSSGAPDAGAGVDRSAVNGERARIGP